MANFEITINAKPNTPYQHRINTFHKGENCSGFIFENTLSIGGTTPIIDNVILLAPHNLPTAGLTLTKMYVKNYTSTDNNRLWYEYDGVKLDSNELEIDITGLNYDDIIPLFLLKGNQDPLDNTTHTINCEIALEDNSPQKYEYKTNQMTVYYSVCTS